MGAESWFETRRRRGRRRDGVKGAFLKSKFQNSKIPIRKEGYHAKTPRREEGLEILPESVFRSSYIKGVFNQDMTI
jgi:hypothetical protein